MGLAICATSRRPAKELDARLTRPGRMDRWLEMLGDAMDCCGNNHVKVGSDCVTQIFIIRYLNASTLRGSEKDCTLVRWRDASGSACCQKCRGHEP